MRPHRHLLILTALLLVGGLVAVWRPEFWPMWQLTGAGLLGLAFLDALLSRAPLKLKLERDVPHSLSVGAWANCKLRLHNGSGRRLTLALFDHCAGDASLNLKMRDLPQTLRLDADGWGTIQWQLKPQVRGDLILGAVQVLADSPLKLWQRNIKLGALQPVRVYPNFAALTQYNLLATHNRVSQLGIKKRRRRGEGQEFHQLRDYREGDSLRQIDWKASARRQNLISREYQDERDQQLLFLLDCGRRMRAQDVEAGDGTEAGLAHFDHALNAMLLLSYVALRQGDAVGLQCFGGVDRGMAPRKGLATINQLLSASYNLQPTLVAADYIALAERVLRQQRKRSLLVILTNLRDEDQEELQASLKQLRHRHLVLVANLHEQALDSALLQPIANFDAALLHAATAEFIEATGQSEAALSANGVHLLSSTPAKLPPLLVNRYLEIKRAGVL